MDIKPVDEHEPIMTGNGLHQPRQGDTVKPAAYLRGQLTQLQRVVGGLADARMDVDLSDAAPGRLVDDPGLEIGLRQPVGLSVPKLPFRLHARQVCFGSAAMP